MSPAAAPPQPPLQPAASHNAPQTVTVAPRAQAPGLQVAVVGGEYAGRRGRVYRARIPEVPGFVSVAVSEAPGFAFVHVGHCRLLS